MKLLHVAAGNSYGGIERMLVTFAETRVPGLSQAFAVSFAGRFERELRGVGAVVQRVASPRASRPLMIWRARREFASLLAAEAPEAAIFHGAWPHAMFAARARRCGVRIGFWQHQPIARPAWPDRWARSVRPDFAVYNSAFTQARPAFPNVPGVVIHCPVPQPPALNGTDRRRLRAELGAGDDDLVVLMAARFERWKGHDVLLDAVRLVPPACRVRVWIAGGVQQAAEAGYYREVAAKAAAPESCRAVSLLGERTDVPLLMRLADIYCQPNLRGEPFGIAIAEAMRAGLPSIVSTGGSAAELLDDSCALFVAPGDRAAVADALCRLALDRDRRARMGASASARAAVLTDPAGRLQQLAAVVAARAA